MREVLDSLTEAGAPGDRFFYHRLAVVEERGWGRVARLPYSLRVLLESLLRHQGRPGFTAEPVERLARWSPGDPGTGEIPFLPARVLLQDFTGVPCVVDLAALRGALARAGGDPRRVEPRIPVDLVIDHSVQLDEAGHAGAYEANLRREFERNAERYAFLRWGRNAFAKLRVLPPGLGICHQVNMEYLAECVRFEADAAGRRIAASDTVVGTDSHTVMINSLGVLGWGVGGIEAEAAMLGQPIPMPPPRVVGVRLAGRLRAPATPTDLALTVTERLRAKGVVGCFVEFFGPGLDALSVADRAPVANMAPEYGATVGFFPMDRATLEYLRETGRPESHLALVERYCRAQGLWRDADAPAPEFSDVVELDLDRVEPSVAGPRRPQDRRPLAAVGREFEAALTRPAEQKGFGVAAAAAAAEADAGARGRIGHGAVAIASITSCTNTSNPSLMIGAALLARRARARGLRPPPHVRTSFAPGSRAVTAYLRRAGLLADLEALGFHVAAYGCATCIGNSGPLDPAVEAAVRANGLVVAAVLSGNRNFEGRVHPLARANYLCSPPLVVAYALRGTVRGDLAHEPLGVGADGRPVYLREVWPTEDELRSALAAAGRPEDYRAAYARLDAPNPAWDALPGEGGDVYAWKDESTYIREPPFLADFAPDPAPVRDLRGARALAVFGDFVTTDHISPAGAIPKDSPAGRYLIARGVAPADFNSYGARRGNHEVLLRGTFANLRLRNRLADREGGWTRHFPDGAPMTIFDAAEAYRAEGVPLIVLAGQMYGAGSSRDWAAKGPALLGVRAVIAQSFERIHRSNLVGMGVLPLEFPAGADAAALGLDGTETFDVAGLAALTPGAAVRVEARGRDGRRTSFAARARIDTEVEADYFRHGGILPYVLRQFLAAGPAAP